MSSYTVSTPRGDVTVIYWWGNDPWQQFPPCPDCGQCCALQVGENDLCAGAYEGVCHKVWYETYGTKPWEDDRSWELTQDLTVLPF